MELFYLKLFVDLFCRVSQETQEKLVSPVLTAKQ